MKINLNLPNPKLDFTLKSYLLLLTLPVVFSYINTKLLVSIGYQLHVFDREGLMYLYVFGPFVVFISYFLGLLLTPVLVLFIGDKLMSGKRLKKSGTSRILYFLGGFSMYILTLYLIWITDFFNF